MKLFLDNADHDRNATHDEVVGALRQRAREIQALADPELAAAMRRAQACGFRFWQPYSGTAWWGERERARWRDVVFLDPCGPCNACRGRREPGGPLFRGAGQRRCLNGVAHRVPGLARSRRDLDDHHRADHGRGLRVLRSY